MIAHTIEWYKLHDIVTAIAAPNPIPELVAVFILYLPDYQPLENHPCLVASRGQRFKIRHGVHFMLVLAMDDPAIFFLVPLFDAVHWTPYSNITVWSGSSFFPPPLIHQSYISCPVLCPDGLFLFGLSTAF
jgi:hypothetical protein